MDYTGNGPNHPRSLMADEFAKAVGAIMGQYYGVPMEKVEIQTAIFPLSRIRGIPDMGVSLKSANPADSEIPQLIARACDTFSKDYKEATGVPLIYDTKAGAELPFASALFVGHLRNFIKHKGGNEAIEKNLMLAEKLAIAVEPSSTTPRPN